MGWHALPLSRALSLLLLLLAGTFSSAFLLTKKLPSGKQWQWRVCLEMIAPQQEQQLRQSEELAPNEPTINDLRQMTTKAALLAVCGPLSSLPPRSAESGSVSGSGSRSGGSYYYDDVDILKSKPTVCKFILGNPKALFDEPSIAKSVGLDFSTMDPSTPLTALAPLLPVIYIADIHNEYGTLGFMLNKASESTMNDVKPEYRSLRQRPVYLGGVQNRGSSFTMLHNKAGFPENRPFRGIPGDKSSFRLFFSPDVAMANELCSTNDAKPSDFKFFQWSTIWLPKQLDLEYDRKAWLTVKAPLRAIFDDDDAAKSPLWRRLVASLPTGRLS